MTLASVTVVIPTRDRPTALARCLLAVSRLADLVAEVVVVDDGSEDRAAVAAVAAQARARLLRLDGRGPSAARNAGVRAAAGDIICFTDDDCEPDPHWASRLVAGIQGGSQVVGGRTRSGDDSNPFDRAAERVTGHLREFSFVRDPARGFLASNNLACRRSVVEQFPFDERYAVGGEDREWCARIAAHVGPPKLVPDAVIVHTPGLTFRRFWHQQMNYGRGAYRFAGDRLPQPMGWRFYAGLVRGGLADGLQVGGLVLLAQVAAAAGVLSARRRRRRSC